MGALLIGLCYFPVALNKTVLLLPIWLPFLYFMFGRFNARLATVLSFLILITFGLAYYAIVPLFYPQGSLVPFGLINLRLIGVPSLALDHYADFFSHHELTNFCQISFVRRLIGCTYDELGPTIETVYHNGNFNASFLATEGIASVGLALAPLSALVCGMILSFGSGACRHLSPQFIAVSSGISVQMIMNVPLTTALASNGVALLFLLWWGTPEMVAKTTSAPYVVESPALVAAPAE